MKKSLLLPIHLKAQYLRLKWLNVPSWRSIRFSGLRGRENPGWGWGRRYRGDFDYGDGWRSRILCRT